MKHAIEVINGLCIIALLAIVSLSIAARVAVWCFRWVENAWREDKADFQDRKAKSMEGKKS